MHCGRRRLPLLPLLSAGRVLISEQSAQEHSPGRQSLLCPQCDQPVDGDFIWCPHCGVRVKSYACSYCRGSVPTDVSACPHCGAPVQ